MHNQLIAEGSQVPISVLCHLLGVARSTTYYQPHARYLEPHCDPVCVEAVRAVIQAHPTYGVRMTHARLTKGLGMVVNRKKIHRIMRLHRWTCRQRRIGRTPRVEHRKSIAPAPTSAGPPTSPRWTAVRTAGAPLCRSSTAARVKCSAGSWPTPHATKRRSVRWKRPCCSALAPPVALAQDSPCP